MGTHPIFESDFDCLTDMTRKLKIVVVGDKDAGKSCFSNIISGHQSDLGILADHSRSTGGVRILEFESEVENEAIDVELWDTSGDLDQESLWSVYADEMDGVILISKDNISDSFVDFFVEGVPIQKEQSLLWINSPNDQPKPDNVGYKITFDILAEIDQTISKFLNKLASVTRKQQERDEQFSPNNLPRPFFI